MPLARPLPTVIGPTENALRALLTKILSTTRIKTYPSWVVLNAAASGENWQPAVADALKIELSDVDKLLGELRAVGLMADNAALTRAGATELASARSAVSATTSRLVDGISAEEQATAHFVLDQVRGKAEELLRQSFTLAPTTADTDAPPAPGNRTNSV